MVEEQKVAYPNIEKLPESNDVTTRKVIEKDRDYYLKITEGIIVVNIMERIKDYPPTYELEKSGKKTVMHAIALSANRYYWDKYMEYAGKDEIRKALRMTDARKRLPIHYAVCKVGVIPINEIYEQSFEIDGNKDPVRDGCFDPQSGSFYSVDSPLYKAAYFYNVEAYKYLLAKAPNSTYMKNKAKEIFDAYEKHKELPKQ